MFIPSVLMPSSAYKKAILFQWAILLPQLKSNRGSITIRGNSHKTQHITEPQRIPLMRLLHVLWTFLLYVEIIQLCFCKTPDKTGVRLRPKCFSVWHCLSETRSAIYPKSCSLPDSNRPNCQSELPKSVASEEVTGIISKAIDMKCNLHLQQLTCCSKPAALANAMFSSSFYYK